MLTKGHHFPEVSLVVILDADQGLFACDFRATERLAQTITQVAGRAGRGFMAGERSLDPNPFPEHPLLNRLMTEGYEGFAVGAWKSGARPAGHPTPGSPCCARRPRTAPNWTRFCRPPPPPAGPLNETAVKVLGRPAP